MQWSSGVGTFLELLDIFWNFPGLGFARCKLTHDLQVDTAIRIFCEMSKMTTKHLCLSTINLSPKLYSYMPCSDQWEGLLKLMCFDSVIWKFAFHPLSCCCWLINWTLRMMDMEAWHSMGSSRPFGWALHRNLLEIYNLEQGMVEGTLILTVKKQRQSGSL